MVETTTSTIDPTAEDFDSTEVVECDGHCGEKVMRAETACVVAGEMVGKWDEHDGTPAHVGVTGVDGKYPSIEFWCGTCSKSQYDLTKTRTEKVKESVGSRFTRSNIKSALAGGLFTLLAVLSVLMFIP